MHDPIDGGVVDVGCGVVAHIFFFFSDAAAFRSTYYIRQNFQVVLTVLKSKFCKRLSSR